MSTPLEAIFSWMGFSFLCLNVRGRYGGLEVGRNSRTVKLSNSQGLESCLGIEVFSIDLGMEIHIFNIYGPYQDRVPFLDSLLNKSLFDGDYLILGGDFKFSLGLAKVWGPRAREDTLSYYFSQKMIAKSLFDVEPTKLKPTWRNKWVGEDWIANRIDRFIVS